MNAPTPIPVTPASAAETARIMKEFSRPFAPAEVKYKPQVVKTDRCLAIGYVDARTVQDRLDAVVYADGWQTEYVLLPNSSVECRLSVRLGGAWITKADVGSPSDQPDEGDRMKAAYSDALKRAAVMFGIGRYLYRLGGQWVNYDPVKKQVVMPGASAKVSAPVEPTPAPAKAAAQPSAYVRGIAAKLDAAKAIRDGTPVYRGYEADLAAKRVTEIERQQVDALFADLKKRFPEPGPTTVGARA